VAFVVISRPTPLLVYKGVSMMYVMIFMTSQQINSHPSSSVVKDERCRDSFSICFRGVNRDIFTVFLTISISNCVSNSSEKLCEFWSFSSRVDQCFSTAGLRPGTGAWHQLYRAARGSGICHFIFLSIFHEWIFYSGNILKRIISLNMSRSSDPERLNNICLANVSDQDFISLVIDN